MRIAAALLLALASLVLLRGGGSAHADDLLHLATDINYNVRTEEGDVLVTWDVSVTNNDPATEQTAAETVTFYEGVSLPVLAGATELSAQSAEGVPLATSLEETEADVLELAAVTFDERLFFGETYDFQLSYVLPPLRDVSLLVTPGYVFLPLVTVGDEATVSATLPDSPAWESSVEAADCQADASQGVFNCSGSEDVYVAGLLEVLRPDAIETLDFEVPLDDGSLAVALTYFEGEGGLAAHQREVIETALPLIEDAYGVAPTAGEPALNVTHGGRQSVFGYEGLTTCESACEIVVSPVASDHTLVHELAHLWSGLYDERWLAEGFAEWVRLEVAREMPDGLLGEPGPPFMATTSLQLDEWEDPQSLIGAEEDYVETTASGYALSLRFIQTLADEVGEEGLREVNRELAGLGESADSEDYMDALEEVTGINPDALFMLWVFPNSYEERIELRREARSRYEEVAEALRSEGLSEEPLAGIQASIDIWQFGQALADVEEIEGDLGRYYDLLDRLSGLESDADALGLTVPEEIRAAIMRWEFEAADGLFDLARAALGAYGLARERLAKPRNLWERFGLLGDDPDEELERAASAFESGAYERSLDRSGEAVDMVDGAGSAAMRRLLIVAAIFAAFAAAIGVAYWIAHVRQRRLAEP